MSVERSELSVERSAPCGAVFLSYASQDAEAARRIADALRATGVEVWFDQSELVGGDAWDAKIRGQIGSCTLFLPIISANTQARLEGYFRLEWKLAAQRTHTMADEKAFLLPVVIDATRDAEAKVPAEFKRVQWTKLPGGETPGRFCHRVKQLLSGEVEPVGVALRHDSAEPPRRKAAPPTRPTPRPWLVPAIIGTALLVAVVAFFALRPHRSPEEIAKLVEGAQTLTASAAAKSIGAPSAPLTKAQQLIVQARSLYEPWRVATADDLKLAERLLKEANELEPANAEGWASLAILSSALQDFGFDPSDARRGLLISAADRATRLAPDSPYAQFALAIRYGLDRATLDDADRMLRALSERSDVPAFVQHAALRDLAIAEFGKRHTTEALATLEHAASLRGGDPNAHFEMGSLLLRQGRFEEAVAADDRAIALRPDFGAAHAGKLVILLFGLGDLTRTRTALQQIPSRTLRDERIATLGALVWFVSDEHAKADEVLRLIPGDYLESEWAHEPKALLGGLIHDRAGRKDAAIAEWKLGLRAVEHRLAGSPTDLAELKNKAKLLALLGDRTQAEETLHLIEQLAQQSNGRATDATWMIYAALGREAEVADYFERSMKAATARPWFDFNPGYFKFHPSLDAFRSSPRFTALAKEADLIFTVRAQNDLSSGKASTLAAGDESGSATPDKSVAVLAFANLSDDKANEYFSDGISEELLNVLAKVPGLKVTARTSSFHFKGKDTPIPEIARQLGVAYVIEGSVRKAGDKVRITAQLIKAADGFHVWSDTFTRDLKDIFAVQDEIAGLIAQNLSLKLGARSPRADLAVSPQAFELYVQARQAWSLRTPEGFARAEQLLNRALELAPDFVRARAALIDVVQMRSLRESRIGSFGQRHFAELDRLLEQVRGVLAIEPDLAEAHATLGTTLLAKWNLAEAERAYRRATEINPNYATGRHWLGMYLAQEGRMEEALAELKLASELDPLSFIILDNYGWLLYLAGRHGDALRMLDRALALNPGFDQTIRIKAEVLAALGRAAEATALARQIKSLDREMDVFLLGMVGLKAEAGTLWAGLDPRTITNRFRSLLAVGRRDEALAALDDPSGVGYGDCIELCFQPFFDQVRDDPRFIRYLATLGLTEAHARAQAWRAAHPPEKAEAKK